ANTTKGRPLPPLLPLEYCSINRAAKMLDCETEDILHWAEIGAIQLIHKGSQKNGNLSMIREELEWLFNTDFGTVEFMQPTLEGEGFYWTSIDKSLEISFNFSTYNNSIDEINTAFKSVLKNIGDEPLYVDVSLSGFYEILNFTLTQNNSDDRDAINVNTSALKIPNSEIYIFFSNVLIISTPLIGFKDLEKLHNSITKGEKLDNIFNNDEIAKQAQNRKSKRPLENNSKPRTSALISMCKLFIAKQDLNINIKPDGLQTKINQELRKYGIPEIEGERTLLQAYIAAGE
ncbi:MAG: hypothetical protein NWQ54_10855, partial [Paraglaciecola sp.]|nr:hypothetical protein [Paraglaciecola sp.]